MNEWNQLEQEIKKCFRKIEKGQLAGKGTLKKNHNRYFQDLINSKKREYFEQLKLEQEEGLANKNVSMVKINARIAAMRRQLVNNSSQFDNPEARGLEPRGRAYQKIKFTAAGFPVHDYIEDLREIRAIVQADKAKQMSNLRSSFDPEIETVNEETKSTSSVDSDLHILEQHQIPKSHLEPGTDLSRALKNTTNLVVPDLEQKRGAEQQRQLAKLQTMVMTRSKNRKLTLVESLNEELMKERAERSKRFTEGGLDAMMDHERHEMIIQQRENAAQLERQAKIDLLLKGNLMGVRKDELELWKTDPVFLEEWSYQMIDMYFKHDKDSKLKHQMKDILRKTDKELLRWLRNSDSLKTIGQFKNHQIEKTSRRNTKLYDIQDIKELFMGQKGIKKQESMLTEVNLSSPGNDEINRRNSILSAQSKFAFLGLQQHSDVPSENQGDFQTQFGLDFMKQQSLGQTTEAQIQISEHPKQPSHVKFDESQLQNVLQSALKNTDASSKAYSYSEKTTKSAQKDKKGSQIISSQKQQNVLDKNEKLMRAKSASIARRKRHKTPNLSQIDKQFLEHYFFKLQNGYLRQMLDEGLPVIVDENFKNRLYMQLKTEQKTEKAPGASDGENDTKNGSQTQGLIYDTQSEMDEEAQIQKMTQKQIERFYRKKNAKPRPRDIFDMGKVVRERRERKFQKLLREELNEIKMQEQDVRDDDLQKEKSNGQIDIKNQETEQSREGQVDFDSSNQTPTDQNTTPNVINLQQQEAIDEYIKLIQSQSGKSKDAERKNKIAMENLDKIGQNRTSIQVVSKNLKSSFQKQKETHLQKDEDVVVFDSQNQNSLEFLNKNLPQTHQVSTATEQFQNNVESSKRIDGDRQISSNNLEDFMSKNLQKPTATVGDSVEFLSKNSQEKDYKQNKQLLTNYTNSATRSLVRLEKQDSEVGQKDQLDLTNIKSVDQTYPHILDAKMVDYSSAQIKNADLNQIDQNLVDYNRMERKFFTNINSDRQIDSTEQNHMHQYQSRQNSELQNRETLIENNRPRYVEQKPSTALKLRRKRKLLQEIEIEKENERSVKGKRAAGSFTRVGGRPATIKKAFELSLEKAHKTDEKSLMLGINGNKSRLLDSKSPQISQKRRGNIQINAPKIKSTYSKIQQNGQIQLNSVENGERLGFRGIHKNNVLLNAEMDARKNQTSVESNRSLENSVQPSSKFWQFLNDKQIPIYKKQRHASPIMTQSDLIFDFTDIKNGRNQAKAVSTEQNLTRIVQNNSQHPYEIENSGGFTGTGSVNSGNNRTRQSLQNKKLLSVGFKQSLAPFKHDIHTSQTTNSARLNTQASNDSPSSKRKSPVPKQENQKKLQKSPEQKIQPLQTESPFRRQGTKNVQNLGFHTSYGYMNQRISSDAIPQNMAWLLNYKHDTLRQKTCKTEQGATISQDPGKRSKIDHSNHQNMPNVPLMQDHPLVQSLLSGPNTENLGRFLLGQASEMDSSDQKSLEQVLTMGSDQIQKSNQSHRQSVQTGTRGGINPINANNLQDFEVALLQSRLKVNKIQTGARARNIAQRQAQTTANKVLSKNLLTNQSSRQAYGSNLNQKTSGGGTELQQRKDRKSSSKVNNTGLLQSQILQSPLVTQSVEIKSPAVQKQGYHLRQNWTNQAQRSDKELVNINQLPIKFMQKGQNAQNLPGIQLDQNEEDFRDVLRRSLEVRTNSALIDQGEHEIRVDNSSNKSGSSSGHKIRNWQAQKESIDKCQLQQKGKKVSQGFSRSFFGSGVVTQNKPSFVTSKASSIYNRKESQINLGGRSSEMSEQQLHSCELEASSVSNANHKNQGVVIIKSSRKKEGGVEIRSGYKKQHQSEKQVLQKELPQKNDSMQITSVQFTRDQMRKNYGEKTEEQKREEFRNKAAKRYKL